MPGTPRLRRKDLSGEEREDLERGLEAINAELVNRRAITLSVVMTYEEQYQQTLELKRLYSSPYTIAERDQEGTGNTGIVPPHARNEHQMFDHTDLVRNLLIQRENLTFELARRDREGAVRDREGAEPNISSLNTMN